MYLFIVNLSELSLAQTTHSRIIRLIKNALERMWKEATVTSFKLLLGRMSKPTRKPENIQRLVQDLNPGTPK
jgi:hypothetical protein